MASFIRPNDCPFPVDADYRESWRKALLEQIAAIDDVVALSVLASVAEDLADGQPGLWMQFIDPDERRQFMDEIERRSTPVMTRPV